MGSALLGDGAGVGVSEMSVDPGDIGCIVVHHNSLATLWQTVASLIGAGGRVDRILVVDNSGIDLVVPSELAGLHVLSTANRGYGSAVNEGVRRLQELGGSQYVLVVTHEVTVVQGLLTDLAARLAADPTLAVVGPALMNADTGDVWSLGGVVAPTSGAPGHRGYGWTRAQVPASTLLPSAWLDGSFGMYRAGVLECFQFDENYFLYFEEADLHYRLVKEGYGIACDTSVIASQSSNGIPDYFLGRNSRIFMRIHGWGPQKFATPMLLVAKRILKNLLVRGGSSDDLLRGWRDGAQRGS